MFPGEGHPQLLLLLNGGVPAGCSPALEQHPWDVQGFFPCCVVVALGLSQSRQDGAFSPRCSSWLWNHPELCRLPACSHQYPPGWIWGVGIAFMTYLIFVLSAWRGLFNIWNTVDINDNKYIGMSKSRWVFPIGSYWNDSKYCFR